MKTRFLVVLLAGGLFLPWLHSPGLAQSLTWWTELASHKVMQDHPPQPTRKVVIEAARNEYEPFQVVLRADGGDLANVDARMSDLVGPRNTVIPAENVALYRADYVLVTSASGNSGEGDGVPGNPREPGEYVDPLIPFFDPYHATHYAVGTPFTIPKNRLQPIFGDVYVPPDIPAGMYEGTLQLTVGLVPVAEVPVSLKVWDFTIPKERRTATAYGLSFGHILWYHGGPDGAYDEEAMPIIKNYEETLHEFRLDITDPVQGPPGLPDPFFTFDAQGNLIPPDYSAYDSYLQARLDGSYFRDGSGAVMYDSDLFAPGYGRPYSDEEYTKAAADFARHLKEKGFWDRIYVYVHDEPYLFPGALEKIAYDVVWMDMGDPDWKTRMMATNHWVPELDYVIGIWCPLTTHYDQWFSTLPEYTREDYQKLIGRGDKLWFYVCNGTKAPYLGYDIDTIHGHEPRLLHWGAWYEGATGLLFWSTNSWNQSDPWGKLADFDRFPGVARNGDGFLLYPGDHDGTAGPGVGSPAELELDGPVISHRLMMIREGMEDMDYLLLAEDRGGKKFAKKITEKIYTQFGMNPAWYDPENPPWSYDEEELYAARSELAEWLVKNLKPEAEGWGEGGGEGGCSLGASPDYLGAISFGLSWIVIAGIGMASRWRKKYKENPGPRKRSNQSLILELREGAEMKRRRKALFIIGLLILGMIGTACAEGEEDEGATKRPEPIPVDHAFVNAVSAPGDVPADLDPNGPVVGEVAFDIFGKNLVFQGQAITLTVTFTDPDGDLATPSLLVQVLGEDEYWTFDSDQFGAVIGTTALVRMEFSRYFEPGAYIIRVGLRDDAGHVGGLLDHLLIVRPYVTPDVETFVPEDGATNVPLNTAIRAVFSNPLMGDPPTLILTQNSQAVPGTIRLLPSMKGINLVPDTFLQPNTEYVATLTLGEVETGGVKTEVHHFTTGPLVPCPDLSGRVYSVALGAENIIEPAGAEMIFSALPMPRILLKIKTLNEAAGTLESVGAVALENPLRQSLDIPNLRFPAPADNLLNPYFQTGPAVFNIDLYALTDGKIDVAINIYDFSLSGEFSASGDGFENGIETGYLEAQELNDAIRRFLGASYNVCFSLPDVCDAEGHVGFRAENLAGPYEPTIGDFYDLTIFVNPNTVPQASGGVVTVFGDYLLNGDPEGTHTVNLATTHGTLSGGGTCSGTSACSVDTADGAFSVNLTVPAGLAAGTQVTLSASSTSPLGNLNRNKKVLVQ